MKGSYHTRPVRCGLSAVYFTQTETCYTQLPNSFVAAQRECPLGAAQEKSLIKREDLILSWTMVMRSPLKKM